MYRSAIRFNGLEAANESDVLRIYR
jgi:hypothetical protein